MSVLVNGMKMPTSCAYCELIDSLEICPCYEIMHDDFWANKTLQHQRHSGCPLIKIPDGHGRLIDADALIQKFENGKLIVDLIGGDFKEVYDSLCKDMLKELTDAPTIVPADKVGEI